MTIKFKPKRGALEKEPTISNKFLFDHRLSTEAKVLGCAFKYLQNKKFPVDIPFIQDNFNWTKELLDEKIAELEAMLFLWRDESGNLFFSEDFEVSNG